MRFPWSVPGIGTWKERGKKKSHGDDDDEEEAAKDRGNSDIGTRSYGHDGRIDS